MIVAIVKDIFVNELLNLYNCEDDKHLVLEGGGNLLPIER